MISTKPVYWGCRASAYGPVVASRPARTELDSGLPDETASPLETAIGRETVDRYEAALARLRPDERDAIVCRIEFGMTYPEIAAALEKPTSDAARMAVVRALERLTDVMAREKRQEAHSKH